MQPDVARLLSLLCGGTLIVIGVVAVIPGAYTGAIAVAVGFAGSIAASLFAIKVTRKEVVDGQQVTLDRFNEAESRQKRMLEIVERLAAREDRPR